MTVLRRPRLARLLRFTLIVRDLEAVASFYERAFGCTRLRSERTGVGWHVILGLGQQHIELLRPDAAGAAYPLELAASDVRFQHFAIVVADIGAAFERLSGLAQWCPISSGGPQRLPANAGGVSAFKFRDPEGHPLELLSFPSAVASRPRQGCPGDAQGLGIDHSAFSVADSARSIAFYEALGLSVASRSLNHGIEQQRLDGLCAPCVEVTALALPAGGPHLELLCYRGESHLAQGPAGPYDLAATRLVFEASPPPAAASELLDPDGHRLVLLQNG